MRVKSGFEKLEVYQAAEDLADSVWDIVLGWNNLATDTVGKQLIRSADSISANISEGYGRMTPNDNRRFVRFAFGSLYETKNWLRRAYRRKILSKENVAKLSPLMEKLLPMLNGYYNSIGRRQSQRAKSTSRVRS